MLRRIDPGAVVRLARRDLPGPLDVINLISTSRFERYRWYGLLVFPALLAAGGRLQWMGKLERSIEGERQADKLLIVRYPSHRRFLAMTLNPYYLAINKLREAGVSRFEASFTHASHPGEELRREKTLLAVHFNSAPGEDALEDVTALVESAGGKLAYATRSVAALDILEPTVATDPHPLTFGELALFASPEGADLGAALDGLAEQLRSATAGLSLQVYRREHPSVYRPALPFVGRPETVEA